MVFRVALVLGLDDLVAGDGGHRAGRTHVIEQNVLCWLVEVFAPEDAVVKRGGDVAVDELQHLESESRPRWKNRQVSKIFWSKLEAL